ncbi:lysylphosphatidylglycerol synthase transmembrane domain-containing protein [Peptostreptococcus canis]|uniref:Phosphatidylglycerol lysyltransferase n=1 Tax=Peptostreptococcus canis TaxID=1159213 RepID=A0ABR6TJ48_9FIRM|nr:lysylphosphatidylglycerol synthase transmembrane domain-containing protein [Peptostreptococcus canis]MBC2575443.1 flippase-like domain-containing protein [Peptostreptococcus canis]MBP1997365.1 uncharacterized protein (TIRG00374 family) [Peptostreptococcus canis]
MEGLQNKKNQIMGIGFMIVLMIAVISYILKDESVDSILQVISSANSNFIILSISMMIFYNLCEGINIWITMKALKIKASFINCLGYGFVGFYFSSITPSASGGQPAQAYFMKRDGITFTSSSLSLMILLFAHQLVIIVLGIIAFFIKPDVSLTYQTGFNILLFYGFISNAIILIGILMFIFSPKLVFKILNTVGILLYKVKLIKNREKLHKRIDRSIKEYEAGARYMRNNPIPILCVTIVTIFQILSLFIIPYFIYIGFGLGKYSMWEILLTQAILNIAVSSLPLPGSVGASESVFLDMFKGLFGDLIIPGMLLTRIANFYFALIFSGIISLIMYVKKVR